MDMKQVGPAPLSRQVAERLLDLLSTDDAFRVLFKTDARSALEQVGYKPADDELSAAWCVQLKATDVLASKAQIARDREKLGKTLNSIVNFALAVDLVEK